MLDRDKSRKKEDIIIDLGYEQTKVGISCDKVPRKSIRTLNLFKTDDFSPAWEAKLEEFLYRIFFTEINYSPSEKTVVIIENLNTRRQIIESLAKILFKKFDIGKLQVCLSCVTPLYCSGRYTGIVVSSGYNFTEIMGICESYPLMREFQSVNIGSSDITKKLRQLIKINNPEIKDELIKDDYLTDMKMNYSNINPKGEVQVLQYDKLKLKFSDSWILFDGYFGDFENEEYNIAYSFLKMIDSIADVTCLLKVCKNVVLAGGIWHVKGFRNLFKRKVVELLAHESFFKLRNLKVIEEIRFSEIPFGAVDVPWIGCSIASSLTNIEYLTIAKSEYDSKGFSEKIMQTYFLAD